MSKTTECLSSLIELANKKGFLLFDDIIDVSDTFELSISDIDEISESLQLKGIIFYETAPDNLEEDQVDDYSKIDYEEIYKEVLSIDSSLSYLIDSVRSIKPAQYGELPTLLAQAKEGNKYARERLILCHVRVAIKIALSMSKSHDLDLSDTISAAFIGLMTAVDRFDPNGFSTLQSYASLWIQQSIQRECIPIWIDYYFPAHYKEKMIPIYEEYENLIRSTSLGYLEIVEKMSRERELSKEEVIKYLEYALQQHNGKMSLESQINEKFVENEESLQYCSDYLRTEHINITASSLLAILSPKEADIICKRYGINTSHEMTLEQIGSVYGVTRERIRQIESKAMRKLKAKAARFSPEDVKIFDF